MGKGDKKTKRGKITQGSYGKTRPKKSSKPAVAAGKPEKVKAEKPEKAEPKPKAAKPKAEKVEEEVAAEEKPKTTRKKKTEE